MIQAQCFPSDALGYLTFLNRLGQLPGMNLY